MSAFNASEGLYLTSGSSLFHQGSNLNMATQKSSFDVPTEQGRQAHCFRVYRERRSRTRTRWSLLFAHLPHPIPSAFTWTLSHGNRANDYGEA